MNQTFSRCLGAVAALMVLAAGPAWCGETVYHIDPAQSRIEFSFRSTLHKVTGEVHRFAGTFAGRSGLMNHIREGEVIVDTESLDTFHPKRNENMLTMFDSTEFPRIRYRITEVVGVPAVDGPEGRIKLKGVLTIRDQEQPIEIPAAITQTEDGLRLNGSVDLSLKDFELKPPSVAMVIRVFDAVHIEFTALLKEQQT
ncbi:MAG: YceI family protein [Candidatus Omnitrophica bacterium]|nr:YceI family protein [Candidatus Omnitrophota bacterium]